MSQNGPSTRSTQKKSEWCGLQIATKNSLGSILEVTNLYILLGFVNKKFTKNPRTPKILSFTINKTKKYFIFANNSLVPIWLATQQTVKRKEEENSDYHLTMKKFMIFFLVFSC